MRNVFAAIAKSKRTCEGSLQRPRAFEALFGGESGCLHDDIAQWLGNALIPKTRFADRRSGNLLGQAEEQDHAQRVHVASDGCLAETELFGRRELPRSEVNGVNIGVAFVLAGDAEIDDGNPSVGQDDV